MNNTIIDTIHFNIHFNITFFNIIFNIDFYYHVNQIIIHNIECFNGIIINHYDLIMNMMDHMEVISTS